MKEIRDIKIDLVMGNKNPIIERFMEITKDLKIINCDVYNDDGLEFIYFNKEKEWIFYQDAKNGEFWCVYNRYWKIFESEFNFKYEEIQAITKYLVEDALKREVTIPYFLRSRLHTSVEEALKREVDTPQAINPPSIIKVEEALKREVDTPYTNDILLNLVPVEEALKREIGTPDLPILHNSRKVEEALKRKVSTPPSYSGSFMNYQVEEALKRKL